MFDERSAIRKIELFGTLLWARDHFREAQGPVIGLAWRLVLAFSPCPTNRRICLSVDSHGIPVCIIQWASDTLSSRHQ